MRTDLSNTYFRTLIETQINLHQKYFNCSPLFLRFVLLLGNFQLLSLLITDQNIQRGLAPLLYLIRPDLLFESRLAFCYIISFVIFFELMLLNVLVMKRMMSKKAQGVKSNAKVGLLPPFHHLFKLTYSHFSQSFCVYFHIIFQLASLKNLSDAFKSQNFPIILGSIITLLIVEANHLQKVFLCNLSLKLIKQGFQSYAITKLEIIRIIVIEIILVLRIFVKDPDAIALVLIGYSILSLIASVYYDKDFLCLVNEVLIFTHCITLIYSILFILKRTSLMLLITPIALYAIQRFASYQQEVNIFKDDQIYFIIKFIVKLFNSEIKLHDAKYKIQFLVANNQHMIKCQNLRCPCRDFEKKLDINGYFRIEELQCEQIIWQKLDSWAKLISQYASRAINIFLYFDTLNRMGYSIQALQDIDTILNQASKTQKGFLIAKGDVSTSYPSSDFTGRQWSNQSIHTLRFAGQQLSSLDKIRFALQKKAFRKQLTIQFSQVVTKQQEEFGHAISLFVNSEMEDGSIVETIKEAFSLKIQLYQQLEKVEGSFTGSVLFNLSLNAIEKIQKAKEKIEFLYTKFPSFKFQSVVCFYLAEVMNDYFGAFKVQKLTSISDNRILNLIKQQSLNLFSKDVAYLIINIPSNMGSLILEKKSNQATKFFQLQNSAFKDGQSIDFLLPSALRQQHPYFVTEFLITGKNQYFRNVCSSFYKTSAGLICPFSLCIDFYQNNLTQELSFICFFQPLQTTSHFIYVDNNLFITDVSLELFKVAGWTKSQIQENCELINNSLNIPIVKLIPSFPTLLNETKSYTNFQDVKNQTQREQLSINSVSYVANLKITQRNIKSLIYLVEIESLKINNDLASYQTQQTTQHQFESDKNQDFIVSNESKPFHPLDSSEYLIEGQNRITIDEIGSNSQVQIATERQLTAQLNQPNTQQQYLTIPLEVQIRSQKMSPQQKLLAQVESESNKKEIEYFENRQAPNKIEFDAIQDDQGSQVSSLIGIRKSPFFKKYDMLLQIENHKKMSSNFTLTNVFMTLFFLITFSFSLLQLAVTDQQFSQFLQEIDMLLFHSSFFSPLENFLSIRLQILNYNTQRNQRIISENNYWIYYAWLLGKVNYCYQVLQENFINQMSNPYLQEFFTDQYMDVRLMNRVSSETYTVNITLRESLFILIEAHYKFKILYERNESFNQRPFQTYFYANYFPMNEKLETTTALILDYTLARKDLVYSIWINTWAPFCVTSLLIVITSLLYYFKFRKFHQQNIDLFKLLKPHILAFEIDRQQALLAQITQDQNQVFSFQFDIERYEHKLQSEKTMDSNKNENYKQEKFESHNQSRNLPRLPAIISYTIIYGCFFAFSLILYQQTESYLMKYEYTAQFYKQTGDMSYVVPAAYSQRQFAGFLSGFLYLNQTDRLRLNARIIQGVELMQEYGKTLIDLDTEKLLTDSDLIDRLTYIKSNDLCKIFNASEQADFRLYCENSFVGSLQNGLLPSLNFISNYVKTEFSINNFTRAVSYNQFEVEGAFILTRTINSLVYYLKRGLVRSTYQHINLVIALSVTYIVLVLLFTISQYSWIRQSYKREYNFVKKMVFLLPAKTLFLDDNLERKIRSIYATK